MSKTEGESDGTQQHYEPPFPGTEKDLWDLSPMSHLAEGLIEEEKRQKELFDLHPMSHLAEEMEEERKRQEELYNRGTFSHWFED